MTWSVPRLLQPHPSQCHGRHLDVCRPPAVTDVHQDVCPDIDLDVAEVTSALTRSYEESCPCRFAPRRKVPWWSPELAELRRRTRRLLNMVLAAKR